MYTTLNITYYLNKVVEDTRCFLLNIPLSSYVTVFSGESVDGSTDRLLGVFKSGAALDYPINALAP